MGKQMKRTAGIIILTAICCILSWAGVSRADNITWSLENNVLTISGSGEMDNYQNVGPWFSKYYSIRNVVIEDGITSIGDNAFYQCRYLENITIPDSVTRIGKNAFFDCKQMTGFTMPSNVTEIGQGAFSQCSSLTSVVIPYGVTGIGSSTFNECTSLTSISVPSTVTSIGDYAFYNCKLLEHFAMPSSVSIIGREAFEKCNCLKEITIPNGVQTIEYGTFQDCRNLETVSIPLSLTSIANDAFLRSSVSDVYYGGTSENWAAIEIGGYNGSLTGATRHYADGSVAGFWGTELSWTLNSAGTTLTVTGSGEMPDFGQYGGKAPWYGAHETLRTAVISDGVTSIGWAAFKECSGINSITIPDSISRIGNSAFQGCTSLTEITLPAGVTWAGTAAFAGCTNLQGINVDTGNEYYASADGVLFDKEMHTLLVCPGRKSGTYTVPAGVTRIEDGAFAGCAALTEIVLAESTEELGSNLFEGCVCLTAITTEEENGQFTSEDGVLYDKEGNTLLICAPGTEGTFEIREGVTAIGAEAFRNCSALTGITVPTGVTAVGDYAFAGCTGTTEITLPDGLETLGACAFENCAQLAEGVVPFGVSRIQSGTFSGCSGMTSVFIPETVDEIGYNAFSGCTALTDVYYGGSYSSWGYISKYDYHFPGNATIHYDYIHVVFPVSGACGENLSWTLTEDHQLTISGSGNMEDYARWDYDTQHTKAPWQIYHVYIESVTAEAGVGSIGSAAFAGCDKTTEITLPAGLTAIGDYAFAGCTGLAEAVLPEGLTAIGSSAFENCGSLTGITIPETVTAIGSAAFMDCGSITEINIPEAMTAISESAFRGCTGLTEITIPGNVNEVGAYAFFNCTGLTSVTVEPGVTSFGGSAFAGCTGLTAFTIPDTVTTLGNPYAGGSNPFTNCTGLTRIDVETGSMSFAAADGVVFDKNRETLLIYPAGKIGVYKVPDTVTAIESEAFFHCDRMTAVTIPDSVIQIGNSAFAYCSGLTELILPEGLKSIGSSAFASCTGLTEIAFPASLKSFGYRLLADCTSLTSVTLPNAITSIGEGCFNNCSSLTTLRIPSTVKYIEREAFEGCNSLSSVNIPDKVTEIESGLLRDCTSLTSVVISRNVTVIDNGAFDGCSGLKSVTIPASVYYIDSYAFYGCDSLADVYYAGTEENWDDIDIKSGNEPLTGAEIHYRCQPLFGECGEGTVWTLDNSGVLTISGTGNTWNFGYYRHVPWELYLDQIVSVVVEDGVTGIGEKTFNECGKLTDISISRSVDSLPYYAFGYNDSLETVTVDPQNGSYASEDGVLFEKDMKTLVLYPSAKADMEYRVPDGVEQIGAEAFEGACGLRKITLPTGLTRIEMQAFSYCSCLTEMTFPDGLERIGEWAFQSCTGMETVTVPDSVTTIGENAFSKCRSLAEVRYTGTEEEWQQIAVSEGNEPLQNARIIYGYVPGARLDVPELGAIADTGIGRDINTTVTIPSGAEFVRMELGRIDGDGRFETVFTSENYAGGAFTVPGYCLLEAGYWQLRAQAAAGEDTPEGKADSEWIVSAFELMDADLPLMTEVTLSEDLFAFGETADVTYTVADAEAVVRRTVSLNPETGAKLEDTGWPQSYTTGNTGTIEASCLREAAVYHVYFHARYNGIWSEESDEQTITVTPDSYLEVPTVVLDGETVTDTASFAVDEARSFTVTSENAETLECVLTRLLPDNEEECLARMEGKGPTDSFDLSELDPEPGTYRLIFRSGREGWVSRGDREITLILTEPEHLVATGSCGPDLTWQLNDEGLLKITGTGQMIDFRRSRDVAWYPYVSSIKKTVIRNGVQGIGNYAFYYCEQMQEITIADTVTEIGDYAFCRSGLKKLIIPDRVKAIGYGAVEYCAGLTSVTLPRMMNAIEEYAFTSCSSLAEITLPDGIKEIKRSTFDHCSSLASVTVPDSVTKIGREAFNGCSSLTAAVLPAGLTRIEDTAFGDCGSLEDITIPNGVTYIGHSAFSGCCSLEELTIPASVTFIGSGAFSGCTGLTGMVIPAGIISLSPQLFSDCTALASVTLPAGLQEIGDYAFSNCDSLENLAIPAGVTEIGSYAFSECDSLTGMTIPSGVRLIGEGLFMNSDSLTGIVFPAEAYYISRYAFGGCDGLTEFTIPYGICSIDDYAFSSCANLQDVTIPGSVISIGDYAFSNCNALTGITIPNGVETIGSNAFDHCESLASVVLPDSVSSMGTAVFYYCEALTDIMLSRGISAISGWTFAGCTGLAEIRIPDNVTGICESAFFRCDDLADVYYAGTEEDWGTIGIEEGNDAILNAEKHYSTEMFTRILNLPSGTLEIEEYAFTGVNAEVINVPARCRVIGKGAFANCQDLRRIVIRDGVIRIADDAFDNCPKLKVRTDSALVRSVCEARGIPWEWMD